MGKCRECGKEVAPNRTICQKCSQLRYRHKIYMLSPRYCEYCGELLESNTRGTVCVKCRDDVRRGVYDLPPEEPHKKVKEPAWKHAKASGYRYGEMMTKALLRQQKREMAARNKK